jgi:hypothetical protein
MVPLHPVPEKSEKNNAILSLVIKKNCKGN